VIHDRKTAVHYHRHRHTNTTTIHSNHTLWLILLVGVHGAGKHTTLRKLRAAGQLPSGSYVSVDMEYVQHTCEVFLPTYCRDPELCRA
jgi:hypothetical protein